MRSTIDPQRSRSARLPRRRCRGTLLRPRAPALTRRRSRPNTSRLPSRWAVRRHPSHERPPRIRPAPPRTRQLTSTSTVPLPSAWASPIRPRRLSCVHHTRLGPVRTLPRRLQSLIGQSSPLGETSAGTRGPTTPLGRAHTIANPWVQPARRLGNYAQQTPREAWQLGRRHLDLAPISRQASGANHTARSHGPGRKCSPRSLRPGRVNTRLALRIHASLTIHFRKGWSCRGYGCAPHPGGRTGVRPSARTRRALVAAGAGGIVSERECKSDVPSCCVRRTLNRGTGEQE